MPLSYNGITDPYFNLMLRVVVATANAGVAPSSFGRVKALYR